MDDKCRRVMDPENVQSGSLESIFIFDELERRRKLVESGASELLTEEESWMLLRKAGVRV